MALVIFAVFVVTAVCILAAFWLNGIFTYDVAFIADADGAFAIFTFLAFGTLRIALFFRLFVLAGFIDTNLIAGAFGAGIIICSGFACVIDAFFLGCALGAGIFGIVADAFDAGLFGFALGAGIDRIVANAIDTGLFGLAFGAWIGRIVADAADTSLFRFALAAWIAWIVANAADAGLIRCTSAAGVCGIIFTDAIFAGLIGQTGAAWIIGGRRAVITALG